MVFNGILLVIKVLPQALTRVIEMPHLAPPPRLGLRSMLLFIKRGIYGLTTAT